MKHITRPYYISLCWETITRRGPLAHIYILILMFIIAYTFLPIFNKNVVEYIDSSWGLILDTINDVLKHPLYHIEYTLRWAINSKLCRYLCCNLCLNILLERRRLLTLIRFLDSIKRYPIPFKECVPATLITVFFQSNEYLVQRG